MKSGDLLKAKEEYIVHQCNCISTQNRGLSKAISSKFRYADIYSLRRNIPYYKNMAVEDDRPEPGTIHISGNGKEERFVISLFGQYAMGKPLF
jgi:O-acetyl-ADP-ribose deacetylase (regulator of RNase III)